MRGIDRGVPTVLIENAPGSGDTPVDGSGRARARRARARRRHADRALHRHLRGVPGARPAVCRGARSSLAARPDARFVLAGGRPDQIEPAQAQARGARASADGVDLRRAAAGRGDSRATSTPPTCWCRRAARHQHAAEDLSVPRARAVPIVATRLLTHTQVLDDEVAILTDGDAGGLRAPASCARIARSARAPRDVGDARAAARRDASTATRPTWSARARRAATSRAGSRPGSQGTSCDDRPRQADRPGSLQLRGLRRSGDGRAFDAMRFGGPIGRLLAEIAGAGASRRFSAPLAGRRDPRRRHRHRPRGDRARARAARSSPAWTRRRRCWRVARAARADAHAAVDVRRAATRTPGVSRSVVRRGRVPARADAHAGLARSRSRELCRVARERVVFDYPALASAAALQAVGAARRARRRARASRPTASSATGAVARRARARTASASSAPPAVRAADRAAQASSDSAPSPSGSRARSRGSGCCGCVGSPVTVVAERCAS